MFYVRKTPTKSGLRLHHASAIFPRSTFTKIIYVETLRWLHLKQSLKFFIVLVVNKFVIFVPQSP